MIGSRQERNEFFPTLFILGHSFVQEQRVVRLKGRQSGRQSHGTRGMFDGGSKRLSFLGLELEDKSSSPEMQNS